MGRTKFGPDRDCVSGEPAKALGLERILLLLAPIAARAAIIKGGLPWKPRQPIRRPQSRQGGWHYFTPQEAAAVEALVDRLIPPDPETPGGKDAGCAVFIDRQLAGPYGRFEGLYMSGPVPEGHQAAGAAIAGDAGAALSHRRWRRSTQHCRGKYGGKAFRRAVRRSEGRDHRGLEDGSIELEGIDGQRFFKLMLKDTQKGFFADPIYGGNKDMAAWKMIGFPGARYDYRDWVDRHNERYPAAAGRHRRPPGLDADAGEHG